MVDTCTVRRVTGEAMNATTLVMEPTYSTVYAGRCRVQLNDAAPMRPDAGEHRGTLMRTIVQIPVSVTTVRVDDVVTVALSEDTELSGRSFRVAAMFHKTHASARRLECEETQA